MPFMNDLTQTTGEARPLLVYDGDCGFCGYWARYWQRLTGEAVRYAPYQEVAARYPGISRDEFRRAVQYIAPDGKVARAAEASFLTLSHARQGGGVGLALYRHLPGFAALSEIAYAFIARHRSAAHRVSRLLWGAERIPPSYALVTALFLRGLALIYLIAFASFGLQVRGLIGSQGILPVADFLAAVARSYGVERFWLLPTVFWLDASDAALITVCWGGVALSLLLFLNILPRLALALLFVLYLSLFHAGQVFMSFQWDMLLLESGFVGLALSTGSRVAVWLGRWFLFRYILMSGLVKILSGDASWTNWSALRYYFETQPLPTPLAWYAHQLPAAVLSVATAATLFIELALPFLIFLPRRLRFVGAWGIVLLQATILVTGNYNFFNLLSLLLCVLLFDDAALATIVPARLRGALAGPREPGRWGRGFAIAYTALNVTIGSVLLFAMTSRSPLPAPLYAASGIIAPLHIVNRYGPFSIMTTERPEIVIEGSNDGEHWREYRFKYKPVDLSRPPPWNIPHQPRLDWQMWFAALGTREDSPWFDGLLLRLLQNSRDVADLLADNPFPDGAPKYVRAVLYEYRFANAEQQAKGQWWVRQRAGVFYPPVMRADD